jgi:hypothetical protein
VLSTVIAICVALLAGCGQDASPAQPNATHSASRPSTAATIGVPFRVTDTDGAIADVTLNGVRYQPIQGDHGQQIAVLDVTIKGASQKAFHFDVESFYVQYADGPDPYHPDDSNMWGADPQDRTAVQPWLTAGAVTTGRHAHGFLPIRAGRHSLLLIGMADQSAKVLAQWLTTST